VATGKLFSNGVLVKLGLKKKEREREIILCASKILGAVVNNVGAIATWCPRFIEPWHTVT
jgi:hypothetical protein